MSTPVFLFLCLATAGTLGFLYSFIGYPLVLLAARPLLSLRLRPQGPALGALDPGVASVAVVFCAYNEQSVLEQKLANLSEVLAPYGNRAATRIYLDACTDESLSIASRFPNVKVLQGATRRGKSAGMRALLENTREDIVIFTDANVLLDKTSVEHVLQAFARDPGVGCVLGRTSFTNEGESSNSKVEGRYWRFEEALKRLESDLGSCFCGTGAIFALRRQLFVPPRDDIIDDFHTTLNVLFQGYKVVQREDIIVFERASTKPRDEWSRKVRIACRSFNCYRHVRHKLHAMPLLVQFMFYSHKFCRWLSALPLAAALLGALGVIWCLNPWVGALAFGLGLLCSILGAQEIRPFSLVVHALRAILATFVGVTDSLRGKRYITWNPALSTRVADTRIAPSDNDPDTSLSKP